MARKPSVSTEDASISIEDFDDETPAQQDERAFEDAVLMEFGGADGDASWEINVTQVPLNQSNSKGVREVRLFSCDKSEFGSITERCMKYGDGRYRIRIKRNGVLWKQNDIDVKAPPKDTAPAIPSEMSTVLAAIQASNERTMQLIERMAERSNQPAPSFDPVAMMASMAGIMKNFQDMMPQPAPAAAPNNGTELFLEGVRFAKDLAPAEHSSGMTGLVERLLDSPILAKLAEGVQGVPAAPRPLNLPPPLRPMTSAPPLARQRTTSPFPPKVTPRNNPSPVNIEPASPVQFVQPDNEGEDLPEVAPVMAPTPAEFMAALQSSPELQQNVGNAVSYLVTRAEKGTDAVFYADWVLDNWPDEFISVLLEIPDLVTQLQYLVPAVAPHRQWFEKLVAELREIVKDDAGVSGEVLPEVMNAPEQRPASTVNLNGHTGRTSGRESDAGDHVAGSQKG